MVELLPGQCRRPVVAQCALRASDPERGVPRVGRCARAVPGGRSRGPLHRRRLPCLGLCRGRRPDGATIHAGPVRRSSRRGNVRHRRPSFCLARRQPPFPRPPRPPGEGTGLPHRAGRGRVGAGRSRGGARSHRYGERGATGCLRDSGVRLGARNRRAPSRCGCPATGVHGARGVPPARPIPGDRQRQARSRRARPCCPDTAGIPRHLSRGRSHSATHRDGAGPGRGLRRAAGPRTSGRRRRLFRPRRSLLARHASRGAPSRTLWGRATASRLLRNATGRGARQLGRALDSERRGPTALGEAPTGAHP